MKNKEINSYLKHIKTYERELKSIEYLKNIATDGIISIAIAELSEIVDKSEKPLYDIKNYCEVNDITSIIQYGNSNSYKFKSDIEEKISQKIRSEMLYDSNGKYFDVCDIFTDPNIWLYINDEDIDEPQKLKSIVHDIKMMLNYVDTVYIDSYEDDVDGYIFTNKLTRIQGLDLLTFEYYDNDKCENLSVDIDISNEDIIAAYFLEAHK